MSNKTVAVCRAYKVDKKGNRKCKQMGRRPK